MKKLHMVESALQNGTESRSGATKVGDMRVSLSVLSWEPFSKLSGSGESQERDVEVFRTRAADRGRVGSILAFYWLQTTLASRGYSNHV